MTSRARDSAEPHDAATLRALLKDAQRLASAFESRQALKSVADALRLARRLHDVRSEAQALAIATQCHYQRGDYVSAVATGLDACATLGQEAIEGRAHVLQGVALALFSVKEMRRAEHAVRHSLRYAMLLPESTLEPLGRSTLAMILCEAGRFDEALVQLRLARSRFRKLGEELRVKKVVSNAGHAWRMHGVALAAQHDNPGAHRCWLRATRYYRTALGVGHSRLDDAIILGSLGECASLLGHHEQALEYLLAARQRTTPRDTVRIVANIDLRRGIAERALGMWSAAERHFLRALEASESLENEDLPVESREELSRLAHARGDMVGERRWREAARELRDARRTALTGFRRQMRPLWDRFLREDGEPA